jgi:hypothetical protein
MEALWLLAHADIVANVIPWRPFGHEAFAEARALGRPLLLVIGTTWSHATHQLDDESLDEPAIAAQLAARFVAMRVDADRRPDVDIRYQRLAAGASSWPLIAVLAQDGAVRSVARHVSRRRFIELLSGGPGDPPRPADHSISDGDPVDAALAALRSAYTPSYGGFGPPPRPPFAPALELLLAEADPLSLKMARRTLEAMDAGGLHDQLAGGFHRDGADDRWVVPHFEKRAIDQAALFSVYARASVRLGVPRFAEVARGIASYVEARLADPAGGVKNAEDADVGSWDDGSHYTFTLDEARAALAPDELEIAQRAFDLYGRGELTSDPTRNVLFIAASPDELARELGRPEPELARLLARARARLLAARQARPQPAIDETIYVAPSALLARAYLDPASPAPPSARDFALATVERLSREARRPDGSVRHLLGPSADAGELSAWLDDHAALGLAALAAFHATGERAHLSFARELAERLIADFWDEAGGFLDRPRSSDGPGELSRPLLPVRDGAAPSGNALAGRLLLALARAAPETAHHLARLDALLAALLPRAAALGPAGAGLIHLAQERRRGP